MSVRRELLRGLERLDATTAVLQRARQADPIGGMWEAADVQWWWRRRRVTDELALPVWFDESGPVAAAGLTAGADTWQADAFAVPSIMDEEEVWAATLEAGTGPLQVLVGGGDTPMAARARRSGFAITGELSGTAWMDAGRRPPVAPVAGFSTQDRATSPAGPHPMITCNGEEVATRLRQCSLYDPTLDLAVVDEDGTDAACDLYLGAGFVQTSVDRLLTRPARKEDV